MKQLPQITLGADPEFFVRQTERTDQGVVPICGYLGGTKNNPLQMDGMPEGYMYQEDGMCAEVNIPVCTSGKQLLESVERARLWVDRRIEKHGLITSVYTGEAQLTSEHVEKHPELLIIGCDPDFDASSNTPYSPRILEPDPSRYAGFHIHFGFDNPNNIPVHVLVNIVDAAMCGVSLVSCSNYNVPHPRKRATYRPKPYGFEYRSIGTRAMMGLPKDRGGAYIDTAASLLATCLAADPKRLLNFYTEYVIERSINKFDFDYWRKWSFPLARPNVQKMLIPEGVAAKEVA